MSLAGGWRLALTAGLLGVALSRRAPGDTRPNILLFFPDTISAESMGAYGHPVAQTPHFDAFAKQVQGIPCALWTDRLGIWQLGVGGADRF
jgi:hypothetical protein